VQLSKLELSDFRNYSSAEVELAPGLNVVVGGNGQGKTNLIEAVHVLCALGSHRTSSNAPMVAYGAERAVVRGRGVARGREVQVDAEIKAAGGLRILINKLALKSSEAARAGLAGVLFSPEDLNLLKGGPEERRRFTDQAAAQIRPLAAAQKMEFDRVLRQRNGALKAAQMGGRPGGLEVWDQQFISTATEVVSNRLEVIAQLAPLVADHYRDLSGAEAKPSITYACSWARDEFTPDDVRSLLEKAMDRERPREIERGVSLIGPQRDDVGVSLAGEDARLFASQGEQRSLVLSLRLAQRDLVREVRDEDPILLLDDVFSELDDARRRSLGELVRSTGQVIVTATSAAGLPSPPDATFTVERGNVRRNA
jgi:DNA replication and repair protein RecF